MRQYLDLMREILEHGTPKGDRTGTGTLSVFGRMMRFDLREGFPLVTTKKLHLKSVIHELLWFLQGDTNVRYLQDRGVSDLGRMGDRRRQPRPVVRRAMAQLADARRRHDRPDHRADRRRSRKKPNSRRHIVSAWNVEYLPDESRSPQDNVRDGRMALAACHTLFQFYVADGRLSCMLMARSQDFLLGTPFNIASYALLVHMVAQQCDLDVGEFVWVGGDVHLYNNHLEQARLQLSREPRPLAETGDPAETGLDLRLSIRRLRDPRLHPARGDQGPDRGVKRPCPKGSL